MEAISQREIEHLARERYGQSAKVFSFSNRDSGPWQTWFVVSQGSGKIIGCRRSLAELPKLIQRGAAMDCLGKPRAAILQRNSTPR